MNNPSSNAEAAAFTTKLLNYSQRQLGRELQPGFTQLGLQSVPQPPWQLPLAYFTPSKQLLLNCGSNYV